MKGEKFSPFGRGTADFHGCNFFAFTRIRNFDQNGLLFLQKGTKELYVYVCSRASELCQCLTSSLLGMKVQEGAEKVAGKNRRKLACLVSVCKYSFWFWFWFLDEIGRLWRGQEISRVTLKCTTSIMKMTSLIRFFFVTLITQSYISSILYIIN